MYKIYYNYICTNPIKKLKKIYCLFGRENLKINLNFLKMYAHPKVLSTGTYKHTHTHTKKGSIRKTLSSHFVKIVSSNFALSVPRAVLGK